ncbi:TetR/AcrR family transcriptional regulator [Frankia sp. ACN1ag]|uniref:TetR/AcrR family transcriptional regulator n=1 Tax=Frankia sp. ACN1ag TaxID=102891 RepID=UPI0006DC1E4B|nr:TetR/AcrR family transcriptional regulator C-terminal domain-containing protein [Frankia sp. ACN1ag]KQC35270.1 TetR family transcriptional regulator [Frankia sp. ACN1ag]
MPAQVNGRLPRGSLDAEVILVAAERLAAEAGLAEVTIRKVAAALGVQHPAVHYHFPRRHNLVDALLGRAVRRFNEALPVIDSDDWETHLRGYWEGFRAVLRSDPALFELVVGQWAIMGRSQQALDSSYGRIDAQLGVLLRAGFTPEQAGYAYHLLSTYTRGCLVSEHQFARFLGSDRGEALAGSTVNLPGDLDPFPSLRDVTAHGWSYTFATDADFDNGLTVIIAGLRAWLPASD